MGELTLQVARGVEQTLSVLAVALNTTAPDRFTAATSWEGMLNLANEVASKKVSSEEETFSDLSLLIFYNNWKGILSQVRCGRFSWDAVQRRRVCRLPATAGHSWAQLAMQCTWRATAGMWPCKKGVDLPPPARRRCRTAETPLRHARRLWPLCRMPPTA